MHVTLGLCKRSQEAIWIMEKIEQWSRVDLLTCQFSPLSICMQYSSRHEFFPSQTLWVGSSTLGHWFSTVVCSHPQSHIIKCGERASYIPMDYTYTCNGPEPWKNHLGALFPPVLWQSSTCFISRRWPLWHNPRELENSLQREEPRCVSSTGWERWSWKGSSERNNENIIWQERTSHRNREREEHPREEMEFFSFSLFAQKCTIAESANDPLGIPWDQTTSGAKWGGTTTEDTPLFEGRSVAFFATPCSD